MSLFVYDSVMDYFSPFETKMLFSVHGNDRQTNLLSVDLSVAICTLKSCCTFVSLHVMAMHELELLQVNILSTLCTFHKEIASNSFLSAFLGKEQQSNELHLASHGANIS